MVCLLENLIKNLLENYNYNNINFVSEENLIKEKLATMDLKQEEIIKIEKFFKERNMVVNIGSIAPIEGEKYGNFINGLS